MSERRELTIPLADAVERILALVNADAALLHRGRFVSDQIMLEVGGALFYISILNGKIESLQRGPLIMRSWSFAIRGSDEAWRRFWQAPPPPHYHDIFAIAKCGEFRIDGDFQPLMTNLLYFKGLLAVPRRLAEGTH